MTQLLEALMLSGLKVPRALLISAIVSSLVLGCARFGNAQPARDAELSIEVAAAHHMLARAAGHGVEAAEVTVSPLFADSTSAPSVTTLARRDSLRTRMLAVAVGARVAPAGDSSAVHLLLSEPMVRGDSASITVTVAWATARRGRALQGYETVALILARDGSSWRVVRARQLGIS